MERMRGCSRRTSLVRAGRIPALLLVLLAAAALAGGWSVAAAEPLTPATLEQGTLLYDQAEWAWAIRLLDQAITAAPADDPLLIRARELLARCYVKNGQPGQVREQVRLILAREPNWVPDPVFIPPTELAALQAARDDVRAQPATPSPAPPAVTRPVSTPLQRPVVREVKSESKQLGFFIEPEIGARWYSADWGDLFEDEDFEAGTAVEGNLLGPGITVGGTVGFKPIPVLAIVAHGDFGIHAAPEDLTMTDGTDTWSASVIDAAGSLQLLLGLRLYPLGGSEDARVQPYVGFGGGLGSVAWTYSTDFSEEMSWIDTDGVGAFLLAAEVGGDVMITPSFSVGAGGRYVHYMWSDTSVEDNWDTSGLDPNSFGLQLHLGVHF